MGLPQKGERADAAIRYNFFVPFATRRALKQLFLVSLTGCMAAADGDGSEELLSHEQAIVYGNDDRQEVYELEDVALREVARSSMAALIRSELVHRLPSGAVRVAPTTLKAMYNLCEGQRFQEQPAAATCSGVLIDKDLLITAGHCVETEEDCRGLSFVFDYAYSAAEQLQTISGSDVFACRRLVTRTFTEDRLDFAIVQLDRVPSARAPVQVRRQPMLDSEPLITLGFTSGLPLKVDLGAKVRDTRAGTYDFFALDSDTFEGSSGSAILDYDFSLAGVLVRGGDDYKVTAEGCRVANVVPADAGTPEWRWEQASYAGAAIDALCAEGYPSERLCGLTPTCGDGVCSLDPVDADCPQDCEQFCRESGCSKGVGNAVPGDPASRKSRANESGCSLSHGNARRARGPWALLGSLGLIWCAVRRRRFSRAP